MLMPGILERLKASNLSYTGDARLAGLALTSETNYHHETDETSHCNK